MDRRPLGRTGIDLSTVGFGAFKIGRNQGIKYARSYELPTDDQVDQLLSEAASLGISYFDTAPAYGLSEQRLGRWLAGRPDCIVSTKVGETFMDGVSRFDYSQRAVRSSVDQSRRRLGRRHLDIVLVHSSGDDLRILRETDAVPALRDMRDRGDVRAIGFSGKTVEGAAEALAWADVLMIEYHLSDQTHENVIREAHRRGTGIVIKKGLASGVLPPEDAIPFVLGNPAVSSLIIGGLDLDHLRTNVEIAGRRSR